MSPFFTPERLIRDTAVTQVSFPRIPLRWPPIDLWSNTREQRVFCVKHRLSAVNLHILQGAVQNSSHGSSSGCQSSPIWMDENIESALSWLRKLTSSCHEKTQPSTVLWDNSSVWRWLHHQIRCLFKSYLHLSRFWNVRGHQSQEDSWTLTADAAWKEWRDTSQITWKPLCKHTEGPIKSSVALVFLMLGWVWQTPTA